MCVCMCITAENPSLKKVKNELKVPQKNYNWKSISKESEK